MKSRAESLLLEAYRRYLTSDNHEKSKMLTNRWLGLGTEAAYRPLIEMGLARFHDDRTPPKRCMGWICLTESGVDAYRGAAHAANETQG